MNPYTIRFADQKDVPMILEYIKKLAEHHDAIHKVKITKEQLENDLPESWFDVMLLEVDGFLVGTSMIFNGYSSWHGRMMFMEELYIHHDYRKSGYGQILYDAVLAEAKRRKCVLLHWQVAPDNESGISFYKKNDAHLDTYWINASARV